MSERGKRRGQGLVEYVILVGVLAILLVGAIKTFGSSVSAAYDGVTGGIDDVALQIESGAGAPAEWSPGSSNAGPNTGATPVARCRHPRAQVDPVTRVCGRCGREVASR